MPEGHPTTTKVIVELTEQDGRTSMLVTRASVRADSPGAAGWQMALDKLVAYVADQQR